MSWENMHPSSSSSPSKLLVVALCLALLSCTDTEAVVKTPTGEKIPATIVFGDSIVDSGNNNHLVTLVKSNFPPYGHDFRGGKPTGRFTDGFTPADLLAQELGIKESIPAYLDTSLQDEDLPTGVAFASAGTGYDPLTSKTASVISLPKQLKMFEQYLERVRRVVGENRTNDIISRSIYLVVSGSNDIANTYPSLRRFQYDASSYTDLMVNYASSFLQDLYRHGARRIAVFSAPPLGCLPMRRSFAGGILRDCVEGDNVAAQLFNAKLASRLDSFNRKLANSHMVFVNIYDPIFQITQNPQQFGFEVSDKGCCGTGKVEVAVLCNQADPCTCSDVSEYVFWDSYHPTEKAYKLLISSLLPKYINQFF